MSDKIDRACEIVYEHFTGECWHRWRGVPGDDSRFCPKCKKWLFCGINPATEKLGLKPPLATSLDAWAEHIWPVMDNKQKALHWFHLREAISPGKDRARVEDMIFVDPLLHIEAALMVIDTDEAKELARGIRK